MNDYFFDHASTTQCCDDAARQIQLYSSENYGNPESSHRLGQRSANIIQEAREFFSDAFNVEPRQVIFTGSGTEANNLAIQGILFPALFTFQEMKKNLSLNSDLRPPRGLYSIAEHPSVSQTMQSLKPFGIETHEIPLNLQGNQDFSIFPTLSNPSHLQSTLISIQQVNSIVGTLFSVEKIAEKIKRSIPHSVFHTDAIQGFGKVPTLQAPSPIDLVSISAHKIEGPKSVGALIVLNKELLHPVEKNSLIPRLRPLIFGGGQENGYRSGTPSAGLISGFHAAAKIALKNQSDNWKKLENFHTCFKEKLIEKKLISSDLKSGLLHWNSPLNALPSIINLSAPGIPAAALQRLLQEKGCYVSVGSACSSKRKEPDPILKGMGLPIEIQDSAIRISFSARNTLHEIHFLVDSLDESVRRIIQVL